MHYNKTIIIRVPTLIIHYRLIDLWLVSSDRVSLLDKKLSSVSKWDFLTLAHASAHTLQLVKDLEMASDETGEHLLNEIYSAFSI
jgi:hypothetical protein